MAQRPCQCKRSQSGDSLLLFSQWHSKDLCEVFRPCPHSSLKLWPPVSLPLFIKLLKRTVCCLLLSSAILSSGLMTLWFAPSPRLRLLSRQQDPHISAGLDIRQPPPCESLFFVSFLLLQSHRLLPSRSLPLFLKCRPSLRSSDCFSPIFSLLGTLFTPRALIIIFLLMFTIYSSIYSTDAPWSASHRASPRHSLPMGRRACLPVTPRGSSKDHAQSLLLICTWDVPTPYTQLVQKPSPPLSPKIYVPSYLPGFLIASASSSRLETRISIQSTGSGAGLPGFKPWFCLFSSSSLGSYVTCLSVEWGWQ